MCSRPTRYIWGLANEAEAQIAAVQPTVLNAHRRTENRLRLEIFFAAQDEA